jgi:hypothetical protein
MAATLPWRELVLEVGGETPVEAWLEPWSAFCPGRFRVRFLNRFGCFFLERADGRIEMLDVFYGQLEPIAGTLAEFEAMLNDPAGGRSTCLPTTSHGYTGRARSLASTTVTRWLPRRWSAARTPGETRDFLSKPRC